MESSSSIASTKSSTTAPLNIQSSWVQVSPLALNTDTRFSDERIHQKKFDITRVQKTKSKTQNPKRKRVLSETGLQARPQLKVSSSKGWQRLFPCKFDDPTDDYLLKTCESGTSTEQSRMHSTNLADSQTSVRTLSTRNTERSTTMTSDATPMDISIISTATDINVSHVTTKSDLTSISTNLDSKTSKSVDEKDISLSSSKSASTLQQKYEKSTTDISKNLVSNLKERSASQCTFSSSEHTKTSITKAKDENQTVRSKRVPLKIFNDPSEVTTRYLPQMAKPAGKILKSSVTTLRSHQTSSISPGRDDCSTATSNATTENLKVSTSHNNEDHVCLQLHLSRSNQVLSDEISSKSEMKEQEEFPASLEGNYSQALQHLIEKHVQVNDSIYSDQPIVDMKNNSYFLEIHRSQFSDTTSPVERSRMGSNRNQSIGSNYNNNPTIPPSISFMIESPISEEPPRALTLPRPAEMEFTDARNHNYPHLSSEYHNSDYFPRSSWLADSSVGFATDPNAAGATFSWPSSTANFVSSPIVGVKPKSKVSISDVLSRKSGIHPVDKNLPSGHSYESKETSNNYSLHSSRRSGSKSVRFATGLNSTSSGNYSKSPVVSFTSNKTEAISTPNSKSTLVQISVERSSTEPVTSGIPEGSVSDSKFFTAETSTTSPWSKCVPLSKTNIPSHAEHSLTGKQLVTRQYKSCDNLPSPDIHSMKKPQLYSKSNRYLKSRSQSRISAYESLKMIQAELATKHKNIDLSMDVLVPFPPKCHSYCLKPPITDSVFSLPWEEFPSDDIKSLPASPTVTSSRGSLHVNVGQKVAACEDLQGMSAKSSNSSLSILIQPCAPHFDEISLPVKFKPEKKKLRVMSDNRVPKSKDITRLQLSEPVVPPFFLHGDHSNTLLKEQVNKDIVFRKLFQSSNKEHEDPQEADTSKVLKKSLENDAFTPPSDHHSDDHPLIPKSGDANPQKTPSLQKFPLSAFLIVISEFCERFHFYGMRTILMLYLISIGFSANNAAALFHTFIMISYISPVFGSILAESKWGRFKTILYLSTVYSIGAIFITLSSIPEHNLVVFLVYMGLLLISVGAGGIKPCIASFGGDQFTIGQETMRRRFFTMFYFAINCGSILSMLVIPILKADVYCFGKQTCYPLAFALPSLLIISSFMIYFIGKEKFTKVPPKGHILIKVFQCCKYALSQKKKVKGQSQMTHKNWLDYASDKYEKEFINDIRQVIRLHVLLIPLPMFWALFDQQGSRWTLQASYLDGELKNNVFIHPDQMQALNPIFILILIPLFESVIYPFFMKRGRYIIPLHKMLIGGFLASLSFMIAGFLELGMEHNIALSPPDGSIDLQFVSEAPCELLIHLDIHEDFRLFPKEKVVIRRIAIPSTKSLMIEMIPDPLCSPPLQTGEFVFNVREHSSYLILIAVVQHARAPRLDILTVQQDFSSFYKSKPRLRVISFGLVYSFNRGVVDNQYVHITSVDGNEENTLSIRWLRGQQNMGVTDYATLSPGLYNVYYMVNGKWSPQAIVIQLQSCSVQSIVLLQHQYDIENVFVPENEAKCISMLWQIPQYVIMAVAEIFFSVTGIEFIYSQAPDSMKSLLQASWLLTVAAGNLIVVIISKIQVLGEQSTEFFVFALMMVIVLLIFFIFAQKYEYVDEATQTTLNDVRSRTLENVSIIKRKLKHRFWHS